MQVTLNSNPRWQTAKHYKFYQLDDQDLASGSFNANKTIDGFHWVVLNSGSALDVRVGSTYGGLKITPYTGSTKTLYQSGRTACWAYTEINQHLSGTDAYGRDDIELRISTRVTGNISNYNTFISGNSEGIVYGLTTPTYNTPYYHLIYQGSIGWVARFVYFESNGTTVNQDYTNETTVNGLPYIPNCVRLTFGENYVRKIECSPLSASQLDSVTHWKYLGSKISSTASPMIMYTGSTELIFHIGAHQNIATKQIIDVTLQELKIEWRYSKNSAKVLAI